MKELKNLPPMSKTEQVPQTEKELVELTEELKSLIGNESLEEEGSNKRIIFYCIAIVTVVIITWFLMKKPPQDPAESIAGLSEGEGLPEGLTEAGVKWLLENWERLPNQFHDRSTNRRSRAHRRSLSWAQISVIKLEVRRLPNQFL